MKKEELEVNNELPTGWIETELSKCVLLAKAGGTPSTKDSTLYGGMIPFVKIDDISDGSKCLYNTKVKINSKGIRNSAAWIVPKNSLVYSMYASYGIPIINKRRVATSQAMINMIFTKEILVEYMYYYLLFFKERLSSYTKGTTQANLNAEIVNSLPVKLAPLNEQKRIVSKIEKLFSNLDNSDKYLLHLEKQLKRYRQSVLKSAFEGKLTKEWRENQTNLETAESLSESVKKYKEKEYSEQLEIWIKVLEDWEKNGKQGNKPRKPSKEKPIKLDEYIETDLPLNWKWEKLGNHAFVTKLAGFEFTKYVTYKELGDIPVIRGQNILKDRFISRNFIYVDREIMEKLPRSRIFGGELLMVFVGAGLGNVGIAPSDKEYFLGPNVAKIALNKFYNNLFIKYYLSSSLGFKNINSHSKATAQDSISMENIRNVNVPFLTLEEQKEIVNQIEKHFSIIDKLEAVVQQSIKESKRLRQSILKQAFEGKLVEQDSNDESASVLLEKIAKAKEEYLKAQKKQARKK